MNASIDAYRSHSRWSDPGPYADRLRAIDPDPQSVVRVVSGFLSHPMIAPMHGIAVPAAALGDRNLHTVEAILGRVLERNPAALTQARAADERAYPVCAGFARVATAVFREHGLPARCRVGFAAYFNPGHLEDHWVCELWDDGRWRRIDAQLDEQTRALLRDRFEPWDVPADQFLDAQRTWRRMRAGDLDPDRIGLSPFGLRGAWFAAGNLMLDAAALNREELLPWEKWSIGRELRPGSEVPPAWAERFDEVAARLGDAPDAERAAEVYLDQPWLRVTPSVLTFADGEPEELALKDAR